MTNPWMNRVLAAPSPCLLSLQSSKNLSNFKFFTRCGKEFSQKCLDIWSRFDQILPCVKVFSNQIIPSLFSFLFFGFWGDFFCLTCDKVIQRWRARKIVRQIICFFALYWGDKHINKRDIVSWVHVNNIGFAVITIKVDLGAKIWIKIFFFLLIFLFTEVIFLKGSFCLGCLGLLSSKQAFEGIWRNILNNNTIKYDF